MGSSKLNLTNLELNNPEEMIIKLDDPARPFKSLGELRLNVTLWPKTQEDKEQVRNKFYLFMLIRKTINVFINIDP